MAYRGIPALLQKCDSSPSLTAVGPWGATSSSFLFLLVLGNMGSCPAWGPGECPQENLALHTCLCIVIGPILRTP